MRIETFMAKWRNYFNEWTDNTHLGFIIYLERPMADTAHELESYPANIPLHQLAYIGDFSCLTVAAEHQCVSTESHITCISINRRFLRKNTLILCFILNISLKSSRKDNASNHPNRRSHDVPLSITSMNRSSLLSHLTVNQSNEKLTKSAAVFRKGLEFADP